MKNAGFSLVELIVVIAIMAVLAGVAVPVYSAYTETTKAGVDENYAAEVWHAAEIEAALVGEEFDKIEFAADGAWTIKNGDETVTLANVANVVTQKAFQSNEYKLGMTITGTGEDDYTAVTAAPAGGNG